MKYSQMLLWSLIFSTLCGVTLFAAGSRWRFSQTALFNNYIAGFTDHINIHACQPPNQPHINICPFEAEFQEIHLGEWADRLGNVGIVSGFIVLAFSVFGAIGVLQKSQIFLIMMFMFIVLGIGSEYYILDIVLNGNSGFHNDAREELKERIRTEWGVEDLNDFTKMMNALQIKDECCGVSGPEDYVLNHSLPVMTSDGPNTQPVVNPPSCCDREYLNTPDAEAAFKEVLRCGTDSWAASSAHDGCYNKVHEVLYETYGGLIVAFLMGLILYEGGQGILLFMILLRPPPKSPKKSKSSSLTSGRSATRSQSEIPKKRFIPFSKISSYVSSDINRIKSTEIW